MCPTSFSLRILDAIPVFPQTLSISTRYSDNSNKPEHIAAFPSPSEEGECILFTEGRPRGIQPRLGAGKRARSASEETWESFLRKNSEFCSPKETPPPPASPTAGGSGPPAGTGLPARGAAGRSGQRCGPGRLQAPRGGAGAAPGAGGGLGAGPGPPRCPGPCMAHACPRTAAVRAAREPAWLIAGPGRRRARPALDSGWGRAGAAPHGGSPGTWMALPPPPAHALAPIGGGNPETCMAHTTDSPWRGVTYTESRAPLHTMAAAPTFFPSEELD